MKKKCGTVYLVGAGPGDPGLLTLRGMELLRRADVVVHDALVNFDLLRLAPKTAEIINGGKRPRDHAIPQDELNELLIQKARQGKCIVRLKGGDPFVLGRGGEEALKLAAAKVPFEVVPGISSAVAALNYAGIPVTHREIASSFTVLTGHEDPEKAGRAIDWGEISAIPGTKVILMGTERIASIVEALRKNGVPAETPVAMIRWGTLGRQQSVDGTLETIVELAARNDFSAPAVTVIGDVVKLRARLNWFESRALFGQRIVVTRTRDQAGELSHRLGELGAEVLEVPTIRIEPPSDPRDLADAILGLNSYDWIVFTSTNGVNTFFEYFFKAFDDLRDIGGVKIAAVGASTAASIRALHLKVDLVPEEYRATKVADAFKRSEGVENCRILLLRAEVANRELPAALTELGAIIDDVACYRTVPETADLTGAAGKLTESGADWLTFTSGSTVENFHARFNLPEIVKRFPGIRLASIGPETTKKIESHGLKPAFEAKPHTIDGLIAALVEACER